MCFLKHSIAHTNFMCNRVLIIFMSLLNYLFHLNGNLILTKPIKGTGNGSITIRGNELQPGMYLYSLNVDGKEVDTKRMILTDK